MRRLLSLIWVMVAGNALSQPITTDTVKTFEQSRVTIAPIVESVLSQREVVHRLSEELAKKAAIQQNLAQQQALLIAVLTPTKGGTPSPVVTPESIQKRIDELKKTLEAFQDVEANHVNATALVMVSCSALRGEFVATERGISTLVTALRQAGNTPATLKSLRQNTLFGENRAELNKKIAAIKDNYVKMTGSDNPCQLSSLSFEAYFDEVNKFGVTNLNERVVANQANRLTEIAAQLQSVTNLVKAQEIYTDTVNAHNAAVNALSEASVQGMVTVLSHANEAQLIKSPEQSWERPADFAIWGGTLLSSISLGAGYLQSRNGAPESSSSLKALPWLGAGIGALSVLAGEVLKNQNLVPDAARKVADRAATNRLVGLDIQAIARKVADAQEEFEASSLPPLVPEIKVELTEFNSAKVAFTAVLEKAILKVSPPRGSTNAAVSIAAEDIQSEYQKWNEEAAQVSTEFQSVFNQLTTAAPQVKVRVERLSKVLTATTEGVNTLRNLLGSSTDGDCKESRPVVCQDALGTRTTTREFCDMKPSGNKHFASEMLSDDGRKTLLDLGACSLALSMKAREQAELSLAMLDVVASKTKAWENEVGPSLILLHMKKVETAMTDF